jgi:hypothetical protein
MILINSRLVKTISLLLTVAVPVILTAPVYAQTVDTAVNAQVAVDKEAAASQERINEIRDKTQDAASKYAQAVAESESMEKYNKQLASQVGDQEKEMASIERQLVDIETTNREVQPLMQQMVDTLQRFVALDVPFLLEERTNRVQSLKDLMPRADVASASAPSTGALSGYLWAGTIEKPCISILRPLASSPNLPYGSICLNDAESSIALNSASFSVRPVSTPVSGRFAASSAFRMCSDRSGSCSGGSLALMIS